MCAIKVCLISCKQRLCLQGDHPFDWTNTTAGFKPVNWHPEANSLVLTPPNPAASVSNCFCLLTLPDVREFI